MGNAIDHVKLAEHAKAQIQAAQDIHQRHQPGRAGLCSCGRPQPCAVVTACHATIADCRAKLAVIGATLPLSFITSPAAQSGQQAQDRPAAVIDRPEHRPGGSCGAGSQWPQRG